MPLSPIYEDSCTSRNENIKFLITKGKSQFHIMNRHDMAAVGADDEVIKVNRLASRRGRMAGKFFVIPEDTLLKFAQQLNGNVINLID
jgi:hypothetical protein